MKKEITHSVQSNQLSAAQISLQKKEQAEQETLYLLSIPGMKESIQAGLALPLNECEEQLAW